MRNRRNSSNMALNVVCTVIFVIITFIYYYSFQGDILGMTQYAWSDHETHYDRLTGCLIFTAIAILIKSLTGFLLEFPQRLKALVYLPAMMLSGLATAEMVDSNGNVSIPWGVIIFTVVVLTLYPFVVSKLKNLSDYNVSERDGSTILTAWWTNILVILLLTVMMYSMGNTDRTLHTRLKVERLCHEGKYDEALAVGVPKYDRDKALTMWRALALAKTDAMGERLFRYNISNAQKTLLPKQTGEPHALLRDCYPIWQALGFVPRKIDERSEWYLKREIRRGTARSAVKDYLLCTYLINKDLDGFVETLPKYYDKEKSLPKHYAEALVLYKGIKREEGYGELDSLKIDDGVKVDYNDFLAMMRAKKPMLKKQADIRDNYFGTYWYFYFRK